MSEFDGLWKHQNNPVCTEIILLYKVFNLDTMQEESQNMFQYQ